MTSAKKHSRWLAEPELEPGSSASGLQAAWLAEIALVRKAAALRPNPQLCLALQAQHHLAPVSGLCLPESQQVLEGGADAAKNSGLGIRFYLFPTAWLKDKMPHVPKCKTIQLVVTYFPMTTSRELWSQHGHINFWWYTESNVYSFIWFIHSMMHT